jgi:hypothetical protein
MDWNNITTRNEQLKNEEILCNMLEPMNDKERAVIIARLGKLYDMADERYECAALTGQYDTGPYHSLRKETSKMFASEGAFAEAYHAYEKARNVREYFIDHNTVKMDIREYFTEFTGDAPKQAVPVSYIPYWAYKTAPVRARQVTADTAIKSVSDNIMEYGKEQVKTAHAGDWIVRNGEDEYVVTDKIFRKIYNSPQNNKQGERIDYSEERDFEPKPGKEVGLFMQPVHSIEFTAADGSTVRTKVGDQLNLDDFNDIYAMSDDEFTAAYTQSHRDRPLEIEYNGKGLQYTKRSLIPLYKVDEDSRKKNVKLIDERFAKLGKQFDAWQSSKRKKTGIFTRLKQRVLNGLRGTREEGSREMREESFRKTREYIDECTEEIEIAEAEKALDEAREMIDKRTLGM